MAGLLKIKTKRVIRSSVRTSNVAFGKNVHFNYCGLPYPIAWFFLVSIFINSY